MKKLITLFLSIAVLAASSAVLYSCDEVDVNVSADDDDDDDKKDKKSSKTDSDVKKWAESFGDSLVESFAEIVSEDGVTTKWELDGNEMIITLLYDMALITGEEITNEDIAELRQMCAEMEKSTHLEDFPVKDFGIIPEALEGLTLRCCTTDGDTIASCTIGWGNKKEEATVGGTHNDSYGDDAESVVVTTRDHYYGSSYAESEEVSTVYEHYYGSSYAEPEEETTVYEHYYPATEPETIYDVDAMWEELCYGMTPEEIASIEQEFTEMGLSKEDVIDLLMK